MSNPQANAVTQNQGAKYAEALAQNLKEAAANKKVDARVFRCNMMNVRFVFKGGKVASFLGGKYTTNIAHEIAELDEEITNGHPNLTANVEEVVELTEPMEALKQKFITEYLAAQKKSVSSENDAGNTEQSKLNVANSKTVAEGMASSDSSGGQTPSVAPVLGRTIIPGVVATK